MIDNPENTGTKQDTRFQPGQSGNPGGRPKGSRNKATLALECLLDGQAEALMSPLYTAQGALLAEFQMKHRLPEIFATRGNVDAGGLMSYGADIDDLYRRAAVYIDKILRGTKPADLPVEQASKYLVVINLKTAKALGLTIPPTVLARADEVIE
jgi:ABC-type uncharacterized transport system substrate-binding protein